MKTVIADLELDLREIKYLTHDLSHEPDEALVEVAKRRIKQMQSHLDELLQKVEKQNVKEEKKEIFIPTNREEEKPPQAMSTQEILDNILVNLPEVELNVPIENVPTEKEDIIVTLADQIKPTVDLKEAFTLNDTFRYTRELFDGDTAYMNQVLEQMSQMENHQFVCSFLASKVKLANPEESEVLAEFQEQIKKYFT